MGCHSTRGCCSNNPTAVHPAAVPAKSSTITGLVTQPPTGSSYPQIQRCTIHDCVFNNLSTADSLARSDLRNCTLRAEHEKDRVHIKRSTIKNTVVHNSTLKRTTLTDSNLSSVKYGKRLTGQNAQLSEVKNLKHITITDSSIRQSNSIKWTKLRNSDVVQALSLKRAKLDRTRAVNSQISSSTLEDCEVRDAIIDHCSFKGLLLENGIWKNGNLVGRTSDREVIVRSIQDSDTRSSSNPSQGEVINFRTRNVPILNHKQLDSDSDNDSISSASEVGDYLDRDNTDAPASAPVENQQKDSLAPPPYQP